MFLLGVLVDEHAIRIAAATDVDAEAGVAVRGEVRVDQRVLERGDVVLAIRQVLEDRGHGSLGRRLGPPHTGAQPPSIRQRDPLRVDDRDRFRGRAHRPPAAVFQAGPAPAVSDPSWTATALTRLNGSSPGVTA